MSSIVLKILIDRAELRALIARLLQQLQSNRFEEVFSTAHPREGFVTVTTSDARYIEMILLAVQAAVVKAEEKQS